jgi:hypothetical protein
MILHKKLTADEVLEIVAITIGKSLPQEIKESEAEMNLSFDKEHNIEIYLINLPNKESQSS